MASQGKQAETPTGETSPTTEDTKSWPYNLILAIVCVVVAALLYRFTMLHFQELIKKPADVAVVVGALGALFTLIGTVVGAYFGIKSTNDTTDKARKQVDEANHRTEKANEAARNALKGRT
jgi:formate hydrogenlyase subunit 3/multisubunit Na+/H+ antiporter MnhD subunit